MKVLNQITRNSSFLNIGCIFSVTLAALILSGVLAISARAQASDIYITPDGGGNGVCTSNTHPPSWFNNSGNWGNGGAQIGPGTIVHLCGTITVELKPQGNGTPGHPWILKYEPGAASVSPTSWRQAFYSGGHSFWVIDGGVPCGWDPVTQAREGVCNGVIKNSSNVNNSSIAIEVSGAHDYEIKNLEIGPLWTKVAQDHVNPEATLGGCVYANGAGANGKIDHSYFHDVGWCVNFENTPAVFNFVGDHMYMEHMSHFWQWGGCAAGGSSGYIVTNSRMHDPSNWDETPDAGYHHDGIQVDPLPAGNSCTDLDMHNNTFDGDWGVRNTSPIFLEQHTNENISRVKLYNNNFSSANGHIFNNGAMNVVMFDDGQVYNNTIVCPGAGIGLQISGTNLKLRNNVISGCNTFIWANFVSATSWLADDHNVFGDLSSVGGNPAFIYNNAGVCCSGSLAQQLAQWDSNTGGSASVGVASISLNATGQPQAGSPAINAGVNLISLGIAALNSDKNGNARPASDPWTAGAFSSSGSFASAPTPPTGLTAIVTP